MNGILTGTTTMGQNGPGSNTSEEVLCVLQISQTGFSISDAILGRTQDISFGSGPTHTLSVRNAVSVF